MRLDPKSERGQAAVETALTMPLFVFAMLGILQLTVAYHARILSEYAVFKAVRAGSVYRADCKKMEQAALAALAPSMGYSGPLAGTSVPVLYGQILAEAKASALNPLGKRVWIDYQLDNADNGRDFDYQLDEGDDVMRLRVRMAYFFEYRIPFANWIMVKSWIAQQRVYLWANMNPIMPVKEEAFEMPQAQIDSELLNRAYLNALTGKFTVPIVATWSMRMMSQPLEEQVKKTGSWKCK